ncbi:MAG: DNA polymerase I [Chloroflexota bacterium]
MSKGQSTPPLPLSFGEENTRGASSSHNSTQTSADKTDKPQPGGRTLLLLFDGNAIVHRAFHAIQPLTVSRTGEMVNAVHGFAATLLKVLSEIKPTHWGIAFDRPVPTFRHQMFEKYKEQRPPTPEELKSQIQRVHQVADVFGIPRFEVDGFEADDVLATLAAQAGEQEIEAVIVTGDADMLQVVSPGIRVLYPKRTFSDPILFDETGVREKYGLSPSQLSDYKALVGDTSDNIPNIKGIGEKTAAKLVEQFGSIQGIYEHLDQVVPERIRAALEANREQAARSKELATVVKTVPGISLNLERCRVAAYDRAAVVNLFRELEFAALLNRLPQEIGVADSPRVSGLTGVDCHLVTAEPDLDHLATRLSTSPRFALEVITSDKSAMSAGLLGLSIAIQPGEAFYIPLGHQGLEQPPRLPSQIVLNRLRSVFESERPAKLSSNAKLAIIVLSRFGVRLSGVDFDTGIAAYSLGEKATSLSSLTFNRLGVELPSLSELTGAGSKARPLALVPVGEVARCAGNLTEAVLKLESVLRTDLESQGLSRLFAEIEMPLVPVLAEMEMNGVALDENLLRQLSESMGKDIATLEKQIHQVAGQEFNINSPQQLGKVLFEHLKLPIARRTRSGYSTDAAILEELRKDYPLIISPVLEYRQLTKLKSTYLDALPTLINPATGRVHTSFNQTVTATGRLSSSDPNLQNIPVRGGLGRKVRQAFIAAPGKTLLAADYSQIDLRVLAHLSRDPSLTNAFINNEDIHTSTASQVFNVDPSRVTTEMRRVAKTVNFGVIYGMSDYGLEQATDLSREEAARFIETYFQRYPKVKEYLDNTREQAHQLGYVQTLTGRRRYIPEVNSPNRQVREAAERMAINMPVQGTSADIIKIAMIDLYRAMKDRKMTALLTLQVHDELIFEVTPAEKDELIRLSSDIMSGAMSLAVPLKIDIKQGRNWGEME